MADLISIIIPVYNRRSFIEECLESVFLQSYKNWEIIIVDGGSTDGSPEICRKLAENDSRIKLMQTEHIGVSAARNIALDMSMGDYVFFLDSDDVIHPFLLESLLLGAKSADAGMAGTQVINISAKNWGKVKELMRDHAYIDKTIAKTNDEAMAAMFGKRSALGCIGGVMMSRELIGQTRFRTELTIGEDYYFIYENLIKGTGCAELKERWYFARLHTTNSSFDYSFKGFWSRFYRRVLVWKNEESLGRKNFADIQKKDAFGCYLRCISHIGLFSEDAKK